MAKGKYEYWLTEEGKTLLNGWARMGLTDIQIAHNIGISKQTFYEWSKRFSDFADSVKKGKEVVDFEVENSLFKAATGFWTEETTVEKMWDESLGKMVVVKEKTVSKFVPPNPTSQIFWLKNRKGDTWKDKREEKIETVDNSLTVKLVDSLAEYAE